MSVLATASRLIPCTPGSTEQIWEDHAHSDFLSANRHPARDGSVLNQRQSTPASIHHWVNFKRRLLCLPELAHAFNIMHPVLSASSDSMHVLPALSQRLQLKFDQTL